ncbi:hypothetical protein G7939_21010 (plasmid) [Ralstonia solanacearum]|uniref:hypothetical protein n=1 Tax=Ralstonia pseudosolanacearum TaxID=1310165 RepID=UPI000AF4E816|nr:hypothetical protein [Ralstonia pseudosolanacearum]NKF91943.1 hypothetical protein [Ralstonia solanacearum]MCK4118757.1 hypothetical protein [Ralstonia pseudosolanacearum]QIK25895.1 hypothetical protein G7939_21010 [Ralstonia solanacearum]QIK30631.1 hypothetical protein G7947_20095 [Ralstonia solanacearum]QIK36399.1 hypothetical protein G7969_25105 [Ralstonia solanacearum]
MKRIYLFATKSDILLITDAVEAKGAVKYILAHHNLHPKYGPVAPVYQTARDIPDLGIAAATQTGRCERYLVAESSTEVKPMARYVGENLPEGGEMIAAYEAGNCRECVEVNAGGLWDGQVLLNGLIQTWSDDAAAQRLMRRYASALKKLFGKQINSYWIGPEAYEFLKNGGRLTLNVNADPSFDLRINTQ